MNLTVEMLSGGTQNSGKHLIWPDLVFKKLLYNNRVDGEQRNDSISHYQVKDKT